MVEAIKDGTVGIYADFDNRYLSQASVARTVLHDLPTIDISPFIDGSGEEALLRVAQEMRRACIDIGFFQLVGHGIAVEEFDELLDWGHRFSALPLQEKMKIDAGANPHNQGYIRTGGVNPGANADKAADLKERFAMCRDLYPGERIDDSLTRAGLSIWPDADVLPGFEPFMKAHIEKRISVARHILHALARSLELPETWFDAAHRYPSVMQFFNYYPSCTPGNLLPNQWNFSPHTDYGMITLLSQDENGGLQVRNADGDWIDVPPLRGAFVINLGDLCARWTNDLYTSNLHRVINLSGNARIAVPCFFTPNAAAEIACLPNCHGPGNPPRYGPVTAGDHSRELREQSARTGRPGVSKATAKRFRTN